MDINGIPQLSLEEYYLNVLTTYNKNLHSNSYVVSNEDSLPLAYLLELYSKDFTHKAKSGILSLISNSISQASRHPLISAKLKKRKSFRSAENYEKIRILQEEIQSIFAEDVTDKYDKTLKEYQVAQSEYTSLLSNLSREKEALKHVEENIKATLRFDPKRLDEYKEEYIQINSEIDAAREDFAERKLNA